MKNRKRIENPIKISDNNNVLNTDWLIDWITQQYWSQTPPKEHSSVSSPITMDMNIECFLFSLSKKKLKRIAKPQEKDDLQY